MMMLAALTLCACSWFEDGPEPRGGGSVPVDEISHGMIVLGDKLDDPYSMENMRAAMEKVYPTKGRSVELKPTDVYVRFLPKDEDEYDRLESAGIRLLDHPIDYEIVQEGDYYHDPDIDEEEITWQYAVLPPDFDLDMGVEYEVLDECYIPDNDVTTRADDGIDWRAVEREAYVLTGNAEMLEPETRASETAPSGRITIVDDDYNGGEPIGVAGVMVSCNTFVKFASAYTDEEGYYEFDKKFSSDLRYRIVFRNKASFAIGINLVLVPASMSTLGTASPEGVDVQITKDSDRKLFTRSVVNNAAYDYYMKCVTEDGSICTPPTGTRFWLFQGMSSSSAPMLQQGTIIEGTVLESFLGNYKGLITTFLPDITLGLTGYGSYASIYAVTCHELAHASHFAQVGIDWWNKFIAFILQSYVGSMITYGLGTETDAGYCEVGEMWAYYVENSMYRERYGEDARVRGTSFWFSPQILLNLEERGLDRYGIFAALQPEVHTASSMCSMLQELYPEYESVIAQAFERYGK